LLDFADVQISGEGLSRLRVQAEVADVIRAVFGWGVLEIHKLYSVTAESARGITDQVINKRCAFLVAESCCGGLTEINVVKASLLYLQRKFHVVYNSVVDFLTVGIIPGKL
jgi:hypothetical protein